MESDGGGGGGFTERVVLPGDDLTDAISAVTTNIRLGAGLFQDGERIVATKAGVLAFKEPNRFFVLSSQQRYVPAVGDTVVGVVIDKATEYYKVRLHATGVAQLPVLAFDGASKRNKPNLNVGAVVFARVVVCSKHMDPELSCQVLTGPRKDWMTGQSLFGEMKGGTVTQVSTGLARRLLDPSCALLSGLGAGLPFEVAVGMNGLVWVAANQASHTVAIISAMQRAEHLDEAQCTALAEKLVARVAS